jgi:hypothetical protein
MRSRLAIPPLALATVLAATSAPASAEVNTLVPPPAWVKLVDCSREARSASFYTRMTNIEKGRRMRLRFTLLVKRARRFQAVSAPGLGRWHWSRPGVGAFGYRQTVRGLKRGTSYRMRVSYRWHDAHGEAIATARRRSAACRQFARLPNLTASLTDARPTKIAGVVRYGVRVQNTGAAPARDVDVDLTVDGAVVDTVTIASLRPGESRALGLPGPRCSTSVSVAADPDGLLAESSEKDNGEWLRCAELPSP